MKAQSGWGPVFCLVLAAAGAAFAAALAVNPSAAQTLTTAPVSFPPVTLDGTDQVVTASASPWRVDATGQGDGWNLTLAATDFHNGSGGVIAVDNFAVRLEEGKIVWVAGDALLPAAAQTEFAPLSAGGLKIASAAVGTGNGVYDLSPDFRLTVPAEAYAGSYSATITAAINTGP